MFNFSDRFQELRSTIIGIVLLLASIIVGIVWVSIGLSNWLTNCLGSVWGPIVLGFVCFVPVLIFALIKTFGRNNIRAPLTSQNEYADATAFNMATVLESLSGHSPFLSVTAVVVMTFLVNRFPTILPAIAQILSAYAEEAKVKAAKEAARKANGFEANDSTPSP